ncbi:hypothetical protein ACWTU6_08340 [Mesorhizobium sp. BHbsci]
MLAGIRARLCAGSARLVSTKGEAAHKLKRAVFFEKGGGARYNGAIDSRAASGKAIGY